MKGLSNQIERILANDPRTRDSDKELIIQVLEWLGAEFTPRQLEVLRQINFESVRRVRQKLQEQGKYMPSPEVARQRRLKGMIVEQNAPTAKPEYLGELIEDQPRAISWLND